jgi:hypothetical protein
MSSSELGRKCKDSAPETLFEVERITAMLKPESPILSDRRHRAEADLNPCTFA